jgi:uncharacterized protein YciI
MLNENLEANSMKRVRAALCVLALLLPAIASAERKELRVYHASFLRLGPHAAKVTAEERAKLFVQHLAYRRSLYQAGDLLMYGPFDGSPDPTLRGFSVFRGDKSIDEIRKLVAEDPYVKGGVMVGEVIVWLSEVPKLDKGFGIRVVDVPEH